MLQPLRAAGRVNELDVMWEGFPLFPEQASTIAEGVDSLYFFLVGISVFFSLLIFTLVFVFAIVYRRRSEN